MREMIRSTSMSMNYELLCIRDEYHMLYIIRGSTVFCKVGPDEVIINRIYYEPTEEVIECATQLSIVSVVINLFYLFEAYE